MKRPLALLLACCLALLLAPGAFADGKLTSPKEQFGWNIGDDYRLATYTQFQAYWRKLDQESDRMKVEVMGKTAEGRDQLMAIITSPANHAKLARYKEIAQKLAHAEGLGEQQARALAQEGKAVVWFDGGLHATEVLGAHQLMETVYQLLSKNDPETLRILNDCVILAVHANPDGMELVSSWYMREPDEKKRVSGDIPRLYQKYIGHDNNRDFYMNNQPETRNMSRILFQEWLPQIMYNHHQTGPTGAVLFTPPFRDPFNYYFDPGIPMGLDLVGASMHNRFVMEDKPGFTMRRGANYSTWWNGGLRTIVYFHNMIGLLTETIGNPTPVEIEFVPQRQLPNGDMPFPAAPQKWHFRQSIDYSVTANYAVFDVASRHREQFLYNIYKMGKNSIDRGNSDHWTVTPKWIDAVRDAAEKDRRAPSGPAPTSGPFEPTAAPGGLFAAARGGRSPVVPAKYFEMLRDPKKRDPRGYILPSSQADFPTATKFVNALQRSGITIHRATKEFTVAGKSYPAGSYVVKGAQAFRPHVLDMFEPQDHPNDFASPGGPPIPPYDNAGWTLAFQMGVEFDRILDGFDGPFEKLTDLAKPPAATVASASGAAGFLISPKTNDSFLVANRLIKAGEEVSRVKSGPDAGAFYVSASGKALPVLERAAAELGVGARGVNAKPAELQKLKLLRIGLWDRYGGSMPSGWLRWLLEQYEFPYEVVFPQALDAGNLASRFDVLILPSDAVPERDAREGAPEGGGGGEVFFTRQPSPDRLPNEFKGWLGRVTVARTVPQLKAFLESGGTVLTIGSSTVLARHLGLPVDDHLVEKGAAGDRHLSRDKFYVPGSVLRVSVDDSDPLAFGMAKEVDVFFDNSPVMRLGPDAALRGVRPVAWFASAAPLRSGWAWGQHYLEDGVAVAEAEVGKGHLLLFGPEITFRGQPHGTFKFLLNGIYR
jgi:hypothetical protein